MCKISMDVAELVGNANCRGESVDAREDRIPSSRRTPFVGTHGRCENCPNCVPRTMCWMLKFLFPYSSSEFGRLTTFAHILDVSYEKIASAAAELAMNDLVEVGEFQRIDGTIGARLSRDGRDYFLGKCLECGYLNR